MASPTIHFSEEKVQQKLFKYAAKFTETEARECAGNPRKILLRKSDPSLKDDSDLSMACDLINTLNIGMRYPEPSSLFSESIIREYYLIRLSSLEKIKKCIEKLKDKALGNELSGSEFTTDEEYLSDEEERYLWGQAEVKKPDIKETFYNGPEYERSYPLSKDVHFQRDQMHARVLRPELRRQETAVYPEIMERELAYDILSEREEGLPVVGTSPRARLSSVEEEVSGTLAPEMEEFEGLVKIHEVVQGLLESIREDASEEEKMATITEAKSKREPFQEVSRLVGRTIQKLVDGVASRASAIDSLEMKVRSKERDLEQTYQQLRREQRNIEELHFELSRRKQEPVNLKEFVERFNQGTNTPQAYLNEARDILKSIEYNAWCDERVDGTRTSLTIRMPNPEYIVENREAFLTMAHCINPEIKRRAFNNLIELLEHVVLEPEFANGLPTLLSNLINMAKASSRGESASEKGTVAAGEFQDLDSTIEALPVQACALCIESMLLHHANGNSGLLALDVRNRIFDLTDELSELCGQNAEVKVWIAFAHEGAARLKTDDSTWNAWFRRLASAAQIVTGLAEVVRGDPIAGIQQVSQEFQNLRDECRELITKDQSYGEAMTIRRFCRKAYWDNLMFSHVENLVQSQRRGAFNGPLFYNTISALQFVGIESPDPLIKESAIKLILHYLFIDDMDLQVKVLDSLLQIQKESCRRASQRNPDLYTRFDNTVTVLIELLKVAPGNIKTEVQAKINAISYPHSRFALEDVSGNVIMFMIMRLLKIPRESSFDFDEESLQSIISYHGVDTDIAVRVYECIGRVFDQVSLNRDGETILFGAVTREDCELIKAMQEKVDFQHLNKKSETALHYAIRKEKYDAAIALIQAGIDPNLSDSRRQTPLHRAVEMDVEGSTLKVIEELLKNETYTTSLTMVDVSVRTAVDLAVKKGNIEILKLLWSKGGRLAHNSSSIIAAARAEKNIEEMLLFFLGEIESSSNLTTLEVHALLEHISKDGVSITCSTPFLDEVFKWINSEEDYNQPFKEYFYLPHPVYRRAEANGEEKGEEPEPVGRYEIVVPSGKMSEFESLLQKEDLVLEEIQGMSEINKIGPKGLTPLSAVLLLGDFGKASILLEAGADINMKGPQGNTALHLFAYLRDEVAINFLLDNGADHKIKNEYGDLPIHIFSGNFKLRSPVVLKERDPLPADHLKVHERLIIDVADEVDEFGNTILHHAVARGSSREVIKYLSENFPEQFWIKNFNDRLPIEEGKEAKQKENVDYLLEIQSGGDLIAFNDEFDARTKQVGGLEILLASLDLLYTLKRVLGGGEDQEVPVYNTPNRGEYYGPSPSLKTPYRRRSMSRFYSAVGPMMQTISSSIPLDETGKVSALHVLAREKRAQKSKVDPIEIYLRAGVSLETRVQGYTVLHEAARFSNNRFLSSLLKRKADLEAKTASGSTVLHLLAKTENALAIRYIFEYYKKQYLRLVLMGDGQGNTSAHLACKKGHLESLRALSESIEVQPGVSRLECFGTNDSGMTLVHMACMGKDDGKAKLILEYIFSSITPLAKESIIESRSAGGDTPLMVATKYGLLECVNLLMAHRANIRAADEEAGEIPLHYAVRCGFYEITESLLKKGRETNRLEGDELACFRDLSGETSLHETLVSFNPDILRLLLEYNARPSIGDNYGDTFLHHAAFKGITVPLQATVDFFSEKPSELKKIFHTKNNNQETVLHKACLGKCPSKSREVVDIILKSFSELLNVQDSQGNTPLLLAAKYDLELAMYLVERGAKTKIKNKDGENVLHIVLRHAFNKRGVIAFLESETVYRKLYRLVTKKDNEGITPLHAFAQYAHTQESVERILELLLGNLPGSTLECKKYLHQTDKSESLDSTAEALARVHKHYALANMIITYPAEDLGALYRKQRAERGLYTFQTL